MFVIKDTSLAVRTTMFSFVSLHVPSRELDTRTGLELPDIDNRPVIEDVCSNKEWNKEGNLPQSAMSSKLPSKLIRSSQKCIISNFSRNKQNLLFLLWITKPTSYIKRRESSDFLPNHRPNPDHPIVRTRN